LFVKLNEEHFYILRHQIMQYPTVNDNENYKLLLKLNNDKYKDILNNLLQTATEYNIKLE
jgi:hypothetical protein